MRSGRRPGRDCRGQPRPRAGRGLAGLARAPRDARAARPRRTRRAAVRILDRQAPRGLARARVRRGRLPRCLAARRRLRHPRPLPRRALRDPDARGAGRARDGADGRRRAAAGVARRLRGGARAGLRLDPGERAALERTARLRRRRHGDRRLEGARGLRRAAHAGSRGAALGLSPGGRGGQPWWTRAGAPRAQRPGDAPRRPRGPRGGRRTGGLEARAPDLRAHPSHGDARARQPQRMAHALRHAPAQRGLLGLRDALHGSPAARREPVLAGRSDRA